MAIPKDALHFSEPDRAFLEPHLPPKDGSTPHPNLPFTTLTFATSLDSSLTLTPGAHTAISGPQSKAMTHYLRSRHDAILIGVGTAVADDPSLNCRLAGVDGYGGAGGGLEGQPQPIVVDTMARWNFTEDSKLFRLCREGRGRAPWIITCLKEEILPAGKRDLLRRYGGKFITLDFPTSNAGRKQLDWHGLLAMLGAEGIRSVMVEGGGQIINSLLEPQHHDCINMVIVTIAPMWLGRGGVVVSPERRLDSSGNAIPAARLAGAKWYPFGEDVVLCGHMKKT